jgi:hypothetical protein
MKVSRKNRKFTQVLAYLAILGLSLFVMLFVVSSTWIGYTVKNMCLAAEDAYGGDCVEALSTQLRDESLDYGTRNTTTWALGEIGDQRALPCWRISSPVGFCENPGRGELSQYELQKAIRLIKSGFNLTIGPGGSALKWAMLRWIPHSGDRHNQRPA